MRNFLNNAKTAALFIGTMIGAGFSTGKEIAFYFCKENVISAVCGGFFSGLLCFLFMYCGYKKVKFVGEKTRKIVVFAASVISFSAMFCASEELILAAVGINGGGLLTFCICALTATFKLEKIKYVNFVVALSLAVMLYLICGGKIVFGSDRGYNPLTGIGYASMNILLTAEFAYQTGKGCEKKDIFVVCSITGTVLALYIAFIYSSICGFEYYSMPLLAAASKRDLNIVALCVIFLAVFTTMLSAVKLFFDDFDGSRFGAFGILSLISVFCLNVTFEFVVSRLYELVGYLGSVYSGLAILALIKSFIKKSRFKTGFEKAK